MPGIIRKPCQYLVIDSSYIDRLNPCPEKEENDITPEDRKAFMEEFVVFCEQYEVKLLFATDEGETAKSYLSRRMDNQDDCDISNATMKAHEVFSCLQEHKIEWKEIIVLEVENYMHAEYVFMKYPELNYCHMTRNNPEPEYLTFDHATVMFGRIDAESG